MFFVRPLARWFERDRIRPRTEGVTNPVPRGAATRITQRDDELLAVDLDGLLATHAALIHRIRTAGAWAVSRRSSRP